MPLPRYHGRISPPAESSSQPFVFSCPKGGLVTAIHMNRVGLCYHSPRFRVAQPLGRPAPGLGRSDGVPSQRPLQPCQPRLSGTKLRRFATTWRVVARGEIPMCVICKLAVLPGALSRYAQGRTADARASGFCPAQHCASLPYSIMPVLNRHCLPGGSRFRIGGQLSWSPITMDVRTTSELI